MLLLIAIFSIPFGILALVLQSLRPIALYFAVLFTLFLAALTSGDAIAWCIGGLVCAACFIPARRHSGFRLPPPPER